MICLKDQKQSSAESNHVENILSFPFGGYVCLSLSKNDLLKTTFISFSALNKEIKER